jgi:hypothetical protein
MYTRAKSLPNLYIRNIIPAGAPLPRWRSWGVWAGAISFTHGGYSGTSIETSCACGITIVRLWSTS